MSNDMRVKKTTNNPDFIFPRGKKIDTTVSPQKGVINSTLSPLSNVGLHNDDA